VLKVNLFKLRKNKRFNYTPRYYQGKVIENAYEMGSKIEKYKNTYNQNDIGKNWQDSRLKMRSRKNSSVSFLLLAIIVFLILLFLYIIDFDISIFRN